MFSVLSTTHPHALECLTCVSLVRLFDRYFILYLGFRMRFRAGCLFLCMFLFKMELNHNNPIRFIATCYIQQNECLLNDLVGNYSRFGCGQSGNNRYADCRNNILFVYSRITAGKIINLKNLNFVFTY